MSYEIDLDKRIEEEVQEPEYHKRANIIVDQLKTEPVTDLISPSFKAQWDFKDGHGLEANPYPKNTDNYDKYMMQMAKLQYEEFKRDNLGA